MRRFYVSTFLNPNSTVILEQDQAKHLQKVLRISAGDKVEVFNGYQTALAEVTQAGSQKTLLSVLSVESGMNDKVGSTLCVAMIKPPLFELVIQKATELGVSRIIPIHTSLTQLPPEAYISKMERWHKIVTEACKQSKRTTIPDLLPPMPLENLGHALVSVQLKLILSPSSESASIHDIAERITTADNIVTIVGPEGGLTKQEEQLLTDMDFHKVKIAPYILRTETAAIAIQGILSSYQLS